MKRAFSSSVSFGAVVLMVGLATAAPPTGPAPKQDVLAIVEKSLQKHGPDVHRCFEKALADRLDVSGRIELEVVLGKGGKVASARVKKSERAIPPALAACVEKAAMAFVLDGLEPGASVVLPFAFKPPSAQYVVKAADVSDRAQAAGEKPGPKRAAPFTAKVLADESNVKVKSLSITLLSVGPASRVAMHRHPTSAKVLYLLKGHARLLGPEGVAPVKIDEGAALFIPAAFPHVIENMGRQTTAVFLQAFTPPGPERVYRDPKDPLGRAAFEVIRDSSQAILPPGAALTMVDGNTVAPIPLPGTSSITQRGLIGAKTPGTKGTEVSQLELNDGAELLTKGSAKVEEFYFLQSGAGQLKVAGETLSVEQDSLICIPVSTPFSFRATAIEKSPKAVLLKFSNPVK